MYDGNLVCPLPRATLSNWCDFLVPGTLHLPHGEAVGIKGIAGTDGAGRSCRRGVSGHTVPLSPCPPGSGSRATSLCYCRAPAPAFGECLLSEGTRTPARSL